MRNKAWLWAVEILIVLGVIVFTLKSGSTVGEITLPGGSWIKFNPPSPIPTSNPPSPIPASNPPSPIPTSNPPSPIPASNPPSPIFSNVIKKYCSGSSGNYDWIVWDLYDTNSACTQVRNKFVSFGQEPSRISYGSYFSDANNIIEISCGRRNYKGQVSAFGGNIFNEAVKVVRAEGNLEGSCIYRVLNTPPNQ